MEVMKSTTNFLPGRPKVLISWHRQRAALACEAMPQSHQSARPEEARLQQPIPNPAKCLHPLSWNASNGPPASTPVGTSRIAPAAFLVRLSSPCLTAYLPHVSRTWPRTSRASDFGVIAHIAFWTERRYWKCPPAQPRHAPTTNHLNMLPLTPNSSSESRRPELINFQLLQKHE